MKLTVERSLLCKALAHVQNVADRRAVSPILGHVLLTAAANELTLCSTDLDMSIQETVPVTLIEEGSLTVPAHLTYDIVRKLPEGCAVELVEKKESNELILKAGRSRFSVPTLPAKDFVPLKISELPHQFSLSGSDLGFLISTTRFSISTEETRYYLNGIYLHTRMGKNGLVLRAVSTDGHRLSLADIDEPKGAEGMPDVIIPRKAIYEISKLLEQGGSEAILSLSHTQIKIQVGMVTLISRLIDGTFPDYEKVIPSQATHCLEIDRMKFSEAVDRVSIVSNDKSRGLKMDIEAQKIILSARGLDQATGNEEIESTYMGKKLSLGFNSKYLLDITQQIGEEKILFQFCDETSPVLIRAAGDDKALYVLMPMRL